MAIVGPELKHEAIIKASSDVWKQPETTGLTTASDLASDLEAPTREALLAAQNLCDEPREASTTLAIATSESSAAGCVKLLLTTFALIVVCYWYLFIEGKGWKAMEELRARLAAAGAILLMGVHQSSSQAGNVEAAAVPANGAETDNQGPDTDYDVPANGAETGNQGPETDYGVPANGAETDNQGLDTDYDVPANGIGTGNQGPETDYGVPANGAETDNQGPETDSIDGERLASQATQTHDGNMTAQTPAGDSPSDQTQIHHGEDITDTPANVAAPEAAPEASATETPSTAPNQVPAASQPACELLYTAIAERIGLYGAEAGRIQKVLYDAGTGRRIGKLHSFVSSAHRLTEYFHNGTILEMAMEPSEQEKFVVVPGSLISVREAGKLASTPRTKREKLRASGELTEVTSDDGNKYLQIQRGSVVEFRSLQDAMAFIKGRPPTEEHRESCKRENWTAPQGAITPSPAQAPRRYQPSGGDSANRGMHNDDRWRFRDDYFWNAGGLN